MSRWFRVDDGLVDDPKVQCLSDRLFRAVVNLWCVTSQCGGNLPPVNDIAFKLRLTPAKAAGLLAELRAANLIDEDETGIRPHNWNGRQFKSDVSTERVKRFRKQQRNVSSTVSETPPETEADTEQKEEDAACAASTAKYAFEEGVIRLTPKDFAKWKKAFEHIDLAAELIALAPWAASQREWFHAVSGALAKRNREQKTKTFQPKIPPRSGMEGII
jgi:hypothetical protein